MRKKLLLLLIFNFFLLFTHPGRTNAEGCHNNRKTNVYHCHTGEDGYNRKNWRHWIDEDGDCQNLRQELLIAASEVDVKFKTAKKCRVISGKWWGPYSKKYFTSAEDVDIDHVVPLKEAWLSGGKKWSRAKKQAFANDPDNLLIVHDQLNSSKGSKDIADWLPPNQGFICQYMSIWKRIKERYELKYDETELIAISLIEKKCSN